MHIVLLVIADCCLLVILEDFKVTRCLLTTVLSVFSHKRQHPQKCSLRANFVFQRVSPCVKCWRNFFTSSWQVCKLISWRLWRAHEVDKRKWKDNGGFEEVHMAIMIICFSRMNCMREKIFKFNNAVRREEANDHHTHYSCEQWSFEYASQELFKYKIHHVARIKS